MRIENKIDILDIDSNIVRSSYVKLPDTKWDESFHAFLMDDFGEIDVIINGYIRQCWKKEECGNVDALPVEIIGILKQYFGREYVHLIARNSGVHWKISVSALLGHE